ncbi:hypothetical protein G6F24_016750 [Rhizopus arrhizus]|nr:hypothetical protein G6F24_016750 [Rhizopus arrhizus]
MAGACRQDGRQAGPHFQEIRTLRRQAARNRGIQLVFAGQVLGLHAEGARHHREVGAGQVRAHIAPRICPRLVQADRPVAIVVRHDEQNGQPAFGGGGHFIAHAHDPQSDFVCAICRPPPRAGKTRAAATARAGSRPAPAVDAARP